MRFTVRGVIADGGQPFTIDQELQLKREDRDFTSPIGRHPGADAGLEIPIVEPVLWRHDPSR